MAHLHFKRTVYKSGGGKATARLEYITRQPAQALTAAERQVRYIKEGREDLVYERSRNLPAFAQDNPHSFFQAAETFERRQGVAFEEWKISLPQELTHRQNMAVMHDLVEAIAGNKLPCTYAFHDPTTLDEQHRQPHLHLLISSRQNDGIERTAETHFTRWNSAQPERGGAHKDPAFGHMGSVKAHRVLIADIVNTHLEQAGQSVRVHPDTLHERGIARKPEPKLRPHESREYREHGLISARMQQVLDIRAERVQQMAREHNNARGYWEGRKAELGLTRDLPMAEKLERITAARARTIRHAPERLRVVEREAPGHAIRHEVPRLEQERHREVHHTPERPGAARRVQVLAARRRLQDLAASLGHDEAPASGLKVRLDKDKERDRGYDHGMSW